MACPLCSFVAPEGAAECPSCGAIFAKLRARAEHEKGAPAQLPEPEAPPRFNIWHIRIAAAALVVCWMLGLGLYYHVALNRPQ